MNIKGFILFAAAAANKFHGWQISKTKENDLHLFMLGNMDSTV